MRYCDSESVERIVAEEDACTISIDLQSITPRREQVADECSSPNLDLVVIFDNSDRSPRKRDSSINANRYLLLDVLGRSFSYMEKQTCG